MKIDLKKLFTKELLILYIILFLGGVLRIMALATNSFAFTYDVGRDLIAISQIANLSKLSLIGPTTGIQGVFYGPWWYLILTPFYVIFGGDPRGIDFVMFLAGLATIVLSYVVGKRAGGIFLGLTFGLLVAVSPFLIYTSSQIWNPNLAPLFTLMVVLCIQNIIFGKKLKLINFFFIGFLLALCIDIEIVYGTLLLIGICISLILFAKSKINLKSFALFILGVFIIFSPRIIFEIKHNFLMTRSFMTFLSSSETQQGLSALFQNRVNVFIDQFSSSVAGNTILYGGILILFVVITLIVFYKNIVDTEKVLLKTAIVVVSSFFVGMLFFKHNLYSHYFAGLCVFFILIVSIAIDLVAKKMKSYIFPSIIILVIVLINFNPISFVSDLKKPIFTGDASVYRNQLQVVDYVYNQAKGNKFKYVVYTPPIFDYTYQYLFSWYGPKKYGYKPSEKSNLAFFILEPDYESPQRLSDWLKLREGDGKIVKSTKLPSGIIVQTRTNK